MLCDLAKKWVTIEINHRVSKEASNLLWDLANTKFHPMYVSKGEGSRKIPQISHLREKLYKTKVPPVRMEIGYQDKDNGEVTVLKDVRSSPVSRFPPSMYKRLYEVASVDVS